MKYFTYVKGQSDRKELAFLRLPVNIPIKDYLISINQPALIDIPYLIIDADYDEDIEMRIKEQFASVSGFLGAFGEAM